MARCLRIVFGIMAGLVVFVVTCSCIIPFDTEEIPDREPIGVVVSPNRINCTVTTLPPKGGELPESYSQKLFLLLRRRAS